MAATLKRQVAPGTVFTGLNLFENAPLLTEEECAKFEKSLDRKQWLTDYREVEFD